MSWDPSVKRKLEINQRSWEVRTPVHVASQFYDLAGVRAGAHRLPSFEQDELGELAGRDVVHLQCHLGTDTLCLARAGARAVGLDFSGASVAAARQLAEDAGLDVSYVRSDVYDSVRVLGRGRFDLVYTGKGALVWLPDLDQWASAVAELLRPGGVLYLVEFHPLLSALAEDTAADDLRIEHDYLTTGTASVGEGEFTYTDGPALDGGPSLTYEWAHDLGEVVSAVAGAGLRVDRLVEHDVLAWQPWPWLRKGEDGWWRLPAGVPRLPLTYSLRAVRD